MTTILATIDRPVSIRQTLEAGNDFTGAKPNDGAVDVTPTFADDIFKFDALHVGGLFDFTNTYYYFEKRDALTLVGVELKLDGQGSWSLTREDADGTTVVLWSGTTEGSFVVTADTEIVMPWGTKLLLVTSGATAEMVATIKVVPARCVYNYRSVG